MCFEEANGIMLHLVVEQIVGNFGHYVEYCTTEKYEVVDLKKNTCCPLSSDRIHIRILGQQIIWKFFTKGTGGIVLLQIFGSWESLQCTATKEPYYTTAARKDSKVTSTQDLE